MEMTKVHDERQGVQSPARLPSPDRADESVGRLPPGQRVIDRFPRFGTHLSRPAPAIPVDPVIEVRGPQTAAFEVPLATLATLPRREVVADFHCVAGWTATDVRWEGVPFEAFLQRIIVPALPPDTAVTHVVFRGLDGYRSVVSIEDALGDDVLIADRLDGRPLDCDHGAPVRLVSPAQYGYISTKHLCRIDVHTTEPTGRSWRIDELLLKSHPRARVWEEERHGYLPGRLVRPVYRALLPLFLALCARRYLVSPRGEGQWVRNLRVAGTGELQVGRRTDAFTARELDDDEKVPVLRAYLNRWKMEVGVFFDGAGPTSTDAQLRAIGPCHPAFEVLPPG